MENITKINENIHRCTIPYKDIYTTIYTIKTDEGVLLFDVASYDEDVEKYIVPFLEEVGVSEENLKYVFISHNHTDHSGGLCEFMKKFPKTTIVSKSEKLREKFEGYSFLMPKEKEEILNVLRSIAIPGHTTDSQGVFDTRTNTLICGDSLQLYGIFGSGKWGANIYLINEHIEAIEKLRRMDIDMILTAHDYHPCGYRYEGENIKKALDSCIEPLYKIHNIISDNPHMTDEEVAEIYNGSNNLPTLGAHVAEAVRNAFGTQ